MVGLGELEGETVGLVLLMAAVRQGNRAQDQKNDFEQHHHERNRRDIREPSKADPITIAAHQTTPEPIDQEEPDQGHDRRQQDGPNDVTQNVVPHLVTHHKEQLGLVELLAISVSHKTMRLVCQNPVT